MLRARVLPLVVVVAGCATAPAARETRFSTLSDDAAWRRMSVDAPRLPAWARALAATLPATTAAQVNLDYVQRTQNPLGPVLAGEVRWAVADANRCGYAKQIAEADLAKAGLSAEQMRRLGDADGPPETDRLALAFSRKLTLDAASLTDEEVADLITAYGPDDVVAIVHTVAHANFQQRIFVALGLTTEPGGALAPQQAPPPAEGEIPAAPRPAVAPAAIVGAEYQPPAWSPRTFDEIRAALERQKARAPRIAMPDDVRKARLPRPARKRLGRVAWGTVSMGYQPELTTAWFRTMETFAQEAKLDPVFDKSVFWVVTRTSDCFY
jgi:alkylhydroperoxidase family enzyme